MVGKRRLAVLGACGAIGRVVSARAAREGWEIVALDLAASLAARPPSGAARALDVHDAESVVAAFDGLGPLDGFVNLAGFMTPRRPLAETPDAAFDEAIGGNLRGAFLAAKAALPLLKPRRGAMVNVVSGLAAQSRPGFGPYAAAKAGIVSLTKTLALEAAPDVRVNAVGPSAVDTPFLKGGTGREAAEGPGLDLAGYAAATPLARLATPEDVAGPILFLLGPDSAFMTGQVLWVNGGGYMP